MQIVQDKFHVHKYFHFTKLAFWIGKKKRKLTHADLKRPLLHVNTILRQSHCQASHNKIYII